MLLGLDLDANMSYFNSLKTGEGPLINRIMLECESF